MAARGRDRDDWFGVNFYPWSACEIALDEAAPPAHGRSHAMAGCWPTCCGAATPIPLPLLVTETSANEDVAGRAAWMDETIAAVREVRAAGLPVIGYTWFPLFTMVDWAYRRSALPVDDHLLHLGLWDLHFDERGCWCARRRRWWSSIGGMWLRTNKESTKGHEDTRRSTKRMHSFV